VAPPLAETFARLAPHGAHLGPREEPGWATTAELAGTRLTSALDAVGRSLGTDRPDIRGQRLVELCTWRLAVTAAAGLLGDSRLPDLGAANVRVWVGDDPPDGIGTALRRPAFQALPSDPDAAHPDASPAPDEAALLARLRDVLAREHLAPLVDAVNLATKRPRRALWRSATDRLAAALVWVGELSGSSARACALARIAVAGAPPLNGRAELRTLRAGEIDLLLHVREGCCLYYRIPGNPKCFSCPLLADDERRALIAGG
jgi:hypothetical protein